jgi:hypothetical protein
VVRGNYIGTDVTGTRPLANGVGITVENTAQNDTIGGVAADQGNLIAFNTGGGIVLAADAVGMAVLGNSIHSNGGLGIDLGGDG